MRLHVGCAMWTHKAWQNRFITHPLPASERLKAYAAWCDAVEGNTTFYATPSPATVASWAEQITPGFQFLAKLPRTVTHDRALTGADDETRAFLDLMQPLTDTFWIQLPGAFAPGDTPALSRFLRRLPPLFRYAVEVRHRAFFDNPADTQALENALAEANAEWVPFDTTAFFQSPPTSEAEREAWTKKPRMPRRTKALTDRPIVRYLGRDSTAETVTGWQPWLPIVASWLREGRSPTVFLHTPDNADAPELARRFHNEVKALVPELSPLPDPTPAEPLTLF